MTFLPASQQADMACQFMEWVRIYLPVIYYHKVQHLLNFTTMNISISLKSFHIYISNLLLSIGKAPYFISISLFIGK